MMSALASRLPGLLTARARGVGLCRRRWVRLAWRVDRSSGAGHVNHVENAWNLFKRGLVGVYHHVSAKHLQSYLDEFAFRCSHRSEKAGLMDLVLTGCEAQ